MRISLLLPIVFLILIADPPRLNATSETAVFDSGGKLVEMVDQGDRLSIVCGFQIRLSDGTLVHLQDRFPRLDENISRVDGKYIWEGFRTLTDGEKFKFNTEWTPTPEGTTYLGTVRTEPDSSAIRSVEYVIDIERDVFVGGNSVPNHSLSLTRPEAGFIFDQETEKIELTSADSNRKLEIELGEKSSVKTEDVWEENGGRFYRVRILVPENKIRKSREFRMGLKLKFDGQPERPSANIQMGLPVEGASFDGFGGNFCFGSTHPIADFIRDTVPLAWSRHELKMLLWDQNRSEPVDELKEDFKRIEQIEQREIPWILSCWKLPERFYTDPFAQSPKANRRKIDPTTWDELLPLIGEYLGYLKKNHDAEPEMLSFNEPNIGIGILFTPEEHRDAIIRIGRFLKTSGFKTKMLLGDVTGPEGTYSYLLPTINDPEAMQYVAAIAFHSWGGTTPQEYRKWRDMSHWLDLPLLVTEAGTDPFAWRGRIYDSHLYGIGEIQQMQEMIRYTQPTSILYWEYTGDYRLVRQTEHGIEATSRYEMIRQLSENTPPGSQFLEIHSDQAEVTATAFGKEDQITVHLLNSGPARAADLTDFAPGRWHRFTVTDGAEKDTELPTLTIPPSGKTEIELPALSLTSLKRIPAPPAGD